ncbi:MAG: hypothetical protein EOO43_16355 [Flavobacterium sp.]|nr:MAG: hypothetical protein EOO43_16355 [Flavobacterium sp.]
MNEKLEIEHFIVEDARAFASHCKTEGENIESIYIDFNLKARLISVLINCKNWPTEVDRENIDDIGFNIIANYEEIGKVEYIYRVSTENYSTLKYKIYPG